MRDVEIYTAVRAALLAGFADGTFGAVEVLQRGQGVTIGAETGPAVYMQIIASPRIGWPVRSEIWNAETFDFDHQERQQMEAHVQISALLRDGQDEVSALDLLNRASMVLQGLPALASLRAAGAGVLRVSDVRNPMFTNGQAQFEYDPNFELVLTHEQITLTKTPGAVATDVRVVSI